MMCATPIVGAHHGRPGLAAEPGLGKYEAVFREKKIDETVLPDPTHENLKELGVASFGHRVKLLDAIAALRSDATGKTLSTQRLHRVPQRTRRWSSRRLHPKWASLSRSSNRSWRKPPVSAKPTSTPYFALMARFFGW